MRAPVKLWIDTAAATGHEALFGVPPLERLRRSLGKGQAGTPVILSGPGATGAAWPGASVQSDPVPLGTRLRAALARGPLVALDGANVVDPRLIDFLLGAAGNCLASRGEAERRAVALRLEPELAEAIPPEARDLRAVADALLAAGRIAPLDEQAFPAYINKLRRSLPYWLHAVDSPASRKRLERQMFWDNYKGSTDLLTRWVYPPLVWPLVRLCVRLGVHPNAVTLVSIVLTFAAVPLFAQGDFLWGFVCAYGMSVLDSVDGKLARLTLTDSKIGDVMDHGLDQVHPPFWYFAWAWGLGGHTPDNPLYQAGIWLIVFYVADRIVLGIAKRRLGFTLHAASRMDGAVRSIIARRNITMTIMAIAVPLGVGPAGLYIVTAWQGLTFAWHTARTIRLGWLPGERARPSA
jgi:phosphatidylglycerophosphate synthase